MSAMWRASLGVALAMVVASCSDAGSGTSLLCRIGQTNTFEQCCATADGGYAPCSELAPPGEDGGDSGAAGDGGSGGGQGGDAGGAWDGHEPGGDVSAPQGPGRIAVTPNEVNFGQVNIGQTAQGLVKISNVGGDDLHVTRLEFAGSASFTIEVDVDGDSATPAKVLQVGGPQELDPDITVGGGETTTITVTFAPLTSDAATASLVIFSDDSTLPAGVEVKLRANIDGSCVKVVPSTVNFGTKPVGVSSTLSVQLTSCGTVPLEIYSIALDAAQSSNDFVLDLTTLPGLDAGGTPSVDEPLVIPVNQAVEFQVRYLPPTGNPKDEANQPIPDLGTIRIGNSSPGQTLEIELRGVGVDVNCPQAVITIDEGAEVIPQTVLHLEGDQSLAPDGPVVKWEWHVEQPTGSQSKFVPSGTSPNPTFEANVAGAYVFTLVVWGSTGASSCAQAEAQVVVIPDEAIHVELLWNTPNDADQTDEGPEAGADMDLHFVHPDALAPDASTPDLDGDGKPDGWLDQPFDCFWFNPSPNWGSLDPAVDDDPSLDRDDSDGAGPENLNLNQPEDGKEYLLGVHYWHDHKLGPSYATLRVYVYAELVFELTDVKLINHDMWEVGTIAWPSGKVTTVTGESGGYKITPNYENPFFFQP